MHRLGASVGDLWRGDVRVDSPRFDIGLVPYDDRERGVVRGDGRAIPFRLFLLGLRRRNRDQGRDAVARMWLVGVGTLRTSEVLGDVRRGVSHWGDPAVRGLSRASMRVGDTL